MSRVSVTPTFVRAVIERGDKDQRVLELFAEIKNQCLAKGPRFALVVSEEGELASSQSIHDAVALLCAPTINAVARIAFVSASFAKHELYQYAARTASELGMEASVFWGEPEALAWLLRDLPAPGSNAPLQAVAAQ